MYNYRRNNRIGGGSIFFIVLFLIAIGILVYFYLSDIGKFWDVIPIASIIIMSLSFIIFLFNLIRRAPGSFIFFLFFLLFVAALVFSSLQGPFALFRQATKNIEADNLQEAAENLTGIVEDFPGSKYYNEALGKLPFLYKDIGDCEKTISFFELAEENGLIDLNDLEISMILADCYVKLAEEEAGDNNLETAAINYLQAVDYLKNIIDNYPESNEAFVSTYKVPNHYYEVALIYRNNEEFQKSVDLLHELLEQYPQSEEIEKVNQLLFRNHVERAQEYASELKYFEALEDYAAAQEIAYENNMEGLMDYYSNIILKDISADILKNYAQTLFNDNQYARSLYIYDKILDNNPDFEEEISPLIAQCKIRIISEADHEIMDNLTVVTIWSPENFTFILVNRSEVPIIFYMGRPNAQIIEVGPNERIDIIGETGNYEIAIEIDDTVTPLYNRIEFEENKRYTFTYEQLEQ